MRNGKLMGALLSATVVVAACGGGDNRVIDLRPPAVANTAPVADAGPSQRVAAAGTRIILDGSKSSDAEGDTLTYAWSITALPPKSTAVLVGANTMRPSITLDVEGEYKFGLIVSDGKLQSTESVVTVTVGASTGGGTDPGAGGGTLGPVAALTVSSTSFPDGGEIPTKYGSTGVRGGMNISPAISVGALPANTTNLAVVIDAKCNAADPIGCVIWGVFNMPVTLTIIKENDPLMQQAGAAPGMLWGYSATGSTGYWGPSGGGTGFSDYDVTIAVYALSAPIPRTDSTPYTRARFESNFKNLIIGRGTMGGHFTHPR